MATRESEFPVQEDVRSLTDPPEGRSPHKSATALQPARRRWKRWLWWASPILYVASYGPGYHLILKLIDWTGRGEFGALLAVYAPILYLLMTLPHDNWIRMILESWSGWWAGWFGL